MQSSIARDAKEVIIARALALLNKGLLRLNTNIVIRPTYFPITPNSQNKFEVNGALVVYLGSTQFSTTKALRLLRAETTDMNLMKTLGVISKYTNVPVELLRKLYSDYDGEQMKQTINAFSFDLCENPA